MIGSLLRPGPGRQPCPHHPDRRPAAGQTALVADTSGSAPAVEHDPTFPERIALASANRFFPEFLEFYASRLSDSVATARRHSARQESWSQIAYFPHEAIFDAMAAGNPDEARAAMWMHLNNARKRLKLSSQLQLDKQT
jgi:DNA-binding FadR family transcriptional regulator